MHLINVYNNDSRVPVYRIGLSTTPAANVQRASSLSTANRKDALDKISK